MSVPHANSTVLITGARAPVALHLARLLHGAGRRVILADSPAHPIAAASTACALYRRLPPPRFAPDAYAEAVEALVRSEGVVLVIPTCEEVFYLGQLWRDRAMTARLFAPDMDLLARVHDKHAFIRLVESLGLAVPKTTLLQSRHDLQAVHDRSRELVFKPVWSRFASHVLLRPSHLKNSTPSALRRKCRGWRSVSLPARRSAPMRWPVTASSRRWRSIVRSIVPARAPASASSGSRMWPRASCASRSLASASSVSRGGMEMMAFTRGLNA